MVDKPTSMCGARPLAQASEGIKVNSMRWGGVMCILGNESLRMSWYYQTSTTQLVLRRATESAPQTKSKPEDSKLEVSQTRSRIFCKALDDKAPIVILSRHRFPREWFKCIQQGFEYKGISYSKLNWIPVGGDAEIVAWRLCRAIARRLKRRREDKILWNTPCSLDVNVFRPVQDDGG